jgi:hypothetical protein
MPTEIELSLWVALAAFIVVMLRQFERIIIKRVDAILNRMDKHETEMQGRDVRSDEIQENVRRMVNGSGVQHELRKVAEPKFDGFPPRIVEHERRSTPSSRENLDTAKKYVHKLETQEQQRSEADNHNNKKD